MASETLAEKALTKEIVQETKMAENEELEEVECEEPKMNGDDLKVKQQRKRKSFGEPATPIERPARERKIVERYSESSPDRVSASKVLSIQKGRGMLLEDIPNVAFKLSKRKADENLKVLHRILFGKRTKMHSLKRNIRQFSGFVWEENKEKERAKIKEKLDKCVKEKLLDFCDVLDIQVPTATKKDEILTQVLEFLECPHVTREVSLADKEQSQKRKKDKKRKRKALASSGTASREASSGLSKKRKQSPTAKKGQTYSSEDDEENDEEAESEDRKADSDDKDVAEMMQKKESDHVDLESEDKVKEQTESKAASGKKSKGSLEVISTPEKDSSLTPEKIPSNSIKSPSNSVMRNGAAADDKVPVSPSKSKRSVKGDEKKSKVNQKKSSESKKTSKEQPKKSRSKFPGKEQATKKGKVGVEPAKEEPSREEMHAAVSDILKEVDFNTATLSDILKELAKQFGMDLAHRKTEVKTIIEEVINSMPDEEDEDEHIGESEDAASGSEKELDDNDA